MFKPVHALMILKVPTSCSARSPGAGGVLPRPHIPGVFDGVHHPGLPRRDAPGHPQQLLGSLRPGRIGTGSSDSKLVARVLLGGGWEGSRERNQSGINNSDISLKVF